MSHSQFHCTGRVYLDGVCANVGVLVDVLLHRLATANPVRGKLFSQFFKPSLQTSLPLAPALLVAAVAFLNLSAGGSLGGWATPEPGVLYPLKSLLQLAV